MKSFISTRSKEDTNTPFDLTNTYSLTDATVSDILLELIVSFSYHSESPSAIRWRPNFYFLQRVDFVALDTHPHRSRLNPLQMEAMQQLAAGYQQPEALSCHLRQLAGVANLAQQAPPGTLAP